MPDMPTPTTRELEILKVLWELGPCSVRAVYRQLSAHEDVAYNTVQTLLRIMEEKGLVKHRAEGRVFIYTPTHSRERVVSRFLSKVFDGALDQCILSVLRAKDVKAEELKELERLIAKARRQKQRRKEE